MMTPQLLRQLPTPFRAAIEQRDFDALLSAAESSARQDVDATALSLWRIAHNYGNEALQVLSYLLVRTLAGPTAEAARLWLLVHPTEDLSTLVNILTGLEVLAVEKTGLLDYHFSVLPSFLSRCVVHPAPAVRISVLDFLRNHAAARGWPARIGRTAAQRLAEELEIELANIVIEEEVSELAAVVAGLRSSAIPQRPVIELAPIDKLVVGVERHQDAGELAKFVRSRRLRDHAQWQARHDARPVLTVRVKQGATQNFWSQVRHLFELCKLDNVDRTVNVWAEAPAASEARHLRARPETTNEAFERFRIVGAIARKESTAVDELAELPPRQADAVGKVLAEAGRSGVDAEFMLTSPDVGEAQVVLPLQQAASTINTWLPAAQRAERAAAVRPEVYSDEVPQANTVRQVLQAVDAMLLHGRVVVGDIDNVTTPRQVNYYTQAARVLGFLSEEENKPTPRGRRLLGKSPHERLAIAATAFDQSMVGRAWRAWANAASLVAVAPDSAEDFLQARARGISGSTIPRRASTLRGWLHELLPFY